MRLDFEGVSAGRLSLAEVVVGLEPRDLPVLTDETFDALEALLADVTDADLAFVPRDPASPDAADGWSPAHLVAHVTAGLEEAASQGATLARGVVPPGRSRFQVPVEQLTAVERVRDRLRESRRMCRALLEVWPDEPHLDLTSDLIPRFGPLNALAYHAVGLYHATAHQTQLREALRQAQASRNLVSGAGVNPPILSNSSDARTV
jgi:hypothetical protein